MRFRRRLGTVLIVLGLAALAYAAATLFWRDPVTDLYARWKQDGLESELERSFDAYRRDAGGEAAEGQTVAARREAIARAARRLEDQLVRGGPLGRLVIPKLGIDPVFVHGTRWGPDLSQGPGHYERTTLPGLGGTTGIAGHRT